MVFLLYFNVFKEYLYGAVSVAPDFWVVNTSLIFNTEELAEVTISNQMLF